MLQIQEIFSILNKLIQQTLMLNLQKQKQKSY